MNKLHKYTLGSIFSTIILCLFSLQAYSQQIALLPQGQTTMLQYLVDKQPVLGDLIAKAGLAPLLSGDAKYTFLVPPQAELNNLRNESPQRIRTVLSGHILKGKYLEGDLKDGATVETLAGTKVNICRKKDYTLVNGMRITSANTEVKNGVIHNLSGLISI